jgi:topoisomerase IA-like protein
VVYVSNSNVQALDIFKVTLNKAVRLIKSRRMRWAGHVARMGDSRCAYRVLVERSEEKRPVGRPRCRWEDNIKVDFQEVGW